MEVLPLETCGQREGFYVETEHDPTSPGKDLSDHNGGRVELWAGRLVRTWLLGVCALGQQHWSHWAVIRSWALQPQPEVLVEPAWNKLPADSQAHGCQQEAMSRGCCNDLGPKVVPASQQSGRSRTGEKRTE